MGCFVFFLYGFCPLFFFSVFFGFMRLKKAKAANVTRLSRLCPHRTDERDAEGYTACGNAQRRSASLRCAMKKGTHALAEHAQSSTGLSMARSSGSKLSAADSGFGEAKWSGSGGLSSPHTPAGGLRANTRRGSSLGDARGPTENRTIFFLRRLASAAWGRALVGGARAP